MSKTYDVVIVGLGVAGAYAAYKLSKSGLKVLAVDIKPYDRLGDKPCGDAVGKHHLESLGLADLPQEILEGYVRGIDIFSPSENFKFRVLGDGYEVNRIGLVRYLVKQALDFGLEIKTETAALGPIIRNGFVCGVVLREGNRSVEVGAKVVVDASGNARSIARRLPSEWPVAEGLEIVDSNIAYREVRELHREIEEPDILRIYVSKRVAPGGYWWLFPYSSLPGYVNVGLGIQGGRGYPHPRTLLYQHVLSRELFKGSRLIEAGGAVVPTREPLKSLVWHGIAVVGDAAYTVNPVHGGGKGSAMISANCVASAIIKGLEVGRVDANGLWSANICYMNSYGAKQAVLNVFRLFLQELSDDDIEFGMSKKIIREEDLNVLSLRGDLELSVVDKAMRFLAGLRRPSLLFKLKNVAEYMDKVRVLYDNYPRSPAELPQWSRKVSSLLREYRIRVLEGT
ncbi:MAG: digeranylgeranylglycerophospholipid reductase [Sulfolobales archaeon]